MTARVAIVPASTILAHPNLDLRASAYVVNEARLQHCIKVARHRIQCGLTGLRRAREERATVLAWQNKMGITETEVPRSTAPPEPMRSDDGRY